MAKPIYTDAQVVSTLTNTGGAKWQTPVITYNFPTSGSASMIETWGASHSNASQQAMTNYWMKAWDDVIGSSIVRVADSSKASIGVANTYYTDYAHSYYPNSAGATVWFNPSYGANSGTNNLLNPTLGQWGGVTFGHELGHALGLSHPGAYNGGRPTYEANAVYMQDSQQYTIMSYFDASKTGSDWIASDNLRHFAQTPMMNDIMAIQSLYGVDKATRATNTTYGFHSTAGSSTFDFAVNTHPVLCIYDAGGNDTLDLSGFKTSSRISLVSGSFSDCDAMTNNISIARNALIENAIGGSANDVLIGNQSNNLLNGGGGADTMSGGLGNDTYILDNNMDKVIEGFNQGLDTIFASISYALGANVENLTLSGASAIHGTGNDLNNFLTGNGLNNILLGGGGNDILVGGLGIDRLTGGAGADKFGFIGLLDSSAGINRDVITDFNAAQGDLIDFSVMDANLMLSNNQAFQWADNGFTAHAGEVCMKGDTLMCDVNGDAKADFEVQLMGVARIAHESVLL